MLRMVTALLATLFLAALPVGAVAQLAVTNVTASQRDHDSGLVDIRYRVSGATAPVTVSVRVSSNGGTTWQAVSSVTGDVGPGINNGTRSIVWNAGAEMPEIYWPSTRVEITATGGGPGGGVITINLPGNVPLVMVPIPAGSFVMGSPPEERGRFDREGPQTKVTITQDFYMGKYPVTQAQWSAVMGREWPYLGFPGRPNNPMENVSWNDAQGFITALNAHVFSSGQGPATMRLPTEAEWEYAARAGTTKRFYFGDSLSVGDRCEDDGIRSQYMWYCGNANDQTQPVGQKLPNALGLHDMHGNVWEWVRDWYTDSLPGGSVTDPTGPSTGSRRVARGSSGRWNSYAFSCRSAFRGGNTPSYRRSDAGFRLVSTTTTLPTNVSNQSPVFTLNTRTLDPVVTLVTSQRGNHLISGMPAGSNGFRFEAIINWNDGNQGGGNRSARMRVNRQWHAATLESLSSTRSRASVTVANGFGSVSSTNVLEVEATSRAGRRTQVPGGVYFYPLHPVVENWLGILPFWQIVEATSLEYSSESEVTLWNMSIPSGVASTSAGFGEDTHLSYRPIAGAFSGSKSIWGSFDKKLQYSGVESITGGSITGSGTLNVALAGLGGPVFTGNLALNVDGKSGVGAPVSVVVDALFPPLSPIMQTLRNIPAVGDVLNALRLRAFLLGGLGIKAFWDQADGLCWLGASSIEVNGTLGAEAQAVLELYGAKAGVYAGGTGTPSLQTCPELVFQGITLRGYAGAFAEYLDFALRGEVGWETTFGGSVSKELRFFPQGEVPQWKPLQDQLIEHGKSNRPLDATTRKSKVNMFSHKTLEGSDGATEEILLENVNPIALPVLTSGTAGPLIHFVAIDIDKPWYAASGIGELSFESLDWELSRVTDNEQSEFSPATIEMQNGNLLATWTRVEGDVSGAEGPQDVLPKLEVVVAERGATTGGWSDPDQLTSNSVVDRDPLPIVFGSDQVGVIWIQNSGDEAPGSSTSGDSLLFAERVADVWSSPEVLWGEEKGIISMSTTVDDDGEAHLVFVVDEDGDPNTVEDRELYLLSTAGGIWQTAIKLTDSEVEETLPILLMVNEDPMVVWRSDNALLYSYLAPWNPREVYLEHTLANEAPSLTGVTLGSGAAIAYTVQTGEGVDIVAAFYDGIDDIWSLPRQLTNDEHVESSITMATDGEDLLLAYIKTLTIREDVEVEIDGQTYTIPNVPLPSRSDLALLRHRPGSDPATENGSLSVDPAFPAPDTTATLSATVENRGDRALQDIEVAFYEGDPNAGGSLIGTETINGTLLAGSAKKVTTSWTVRLVTEQMEVFVVVDPDELLEDRNRANNTDSSLLMASRIEIAAGASEPLSETRVRIRTTVANTGNVASTPSELVFRFGDPDGEEVGRVTSPPLAVDSETEIDWIWDIVDQEFDSRYVVIYAVIEDDILGISAQVQFGVEPDEPVTPSPSPTPTPTPSPTATATPTVRPSPSPTVSATPTGTPTPTVSVTPTETPTPTASPSPSSTATPVVTDSPTPSPTVSVTPTETPTPTASPSPSPTATPVVTDSPTPSPTVSVTPTETPTPTASPSPTPVASTRLQALLDALLGRGTGTTPIDENGDGVIDAADIQRVVMGSQ